MMTASFTLKSDVWAWAILVIEIFTDGETPFPYVPTSELPTKIVRGLLPEQPKQCPVEVYGDRFRDRSQECVRGMLSDSLLVLVEVRSVFEACCRIPYSCWFLLV
jgi:hypothetical protein